MKHKYLVMAMCLSAALAFNGCSSDKEDDPIPEEQNQIQGNNEENNQNFFHAFPSVSRICPSRI